MTKKEKIYILKHTPEGCYLSLERDSEDFISEERKSERPGLDTLKTPRWDHWYQRKLARPWQATLLGMNIEPHPNVRNILRHHNDDRYKIYKDRMDILTTLMGYEIGVLEDHLKSGEKANENYIELSEYCIYAEKLNWVNMHEMRNGLKLDTAPPVIEPNAKFEKNVLNFLDVILENSVGAYRNSKGERSPQAVIDWVKEKDASISISASTLALWFKKMNNIMN